MKKNIVSVDRIIRILIAAVLSILTFAGVVNGIFATVFILLAGILVVTSIINFCPLYFLCGINKVKK